MKKLIFSASVIVLLIISSNYSNCQNGWIDNGNYKELSTEDSLQTLHFSSSGDVFYTLHNNKIVYYYIASTGNKFDSLIIPENNAVANFSKDGNTLVYYLKISGLCLQNISLLITIIDLISKTVIKQTTIDIPRDINFFKHYGNAGWIWNTSGTTISILDFKKNSKVLTVGTFFKYYNPIQSGSYSYDFTFYYGGLAFFEISKDTTIKLSQISIKPIVDILQIKQKYYYTIFNFESQEGGSSSLNGKNYKYSFLLGKYNLQDSQYVTLKSESYVYGSSYETGKGTKNYSSGKYAPYSTLFYHSETNSVLMKSLDWYYRYDVDTDDLIDSMQLGNSAGLEKLTPDKSSFIYYDTTKILIQNITNKTITDSTDSPIIPVSLEVSPNGRDIVLADINGKIILYDKVLKYATIPDDNFERALIKLGYDSLPLDNKVPFRNIDTVTYLDLKNMGISDLTGVSSFQNLRWLDCSRNNIEELDVSKNTSLRYLNCSNNFISKLNLGINKNLTYLNCDENRFKQIDVSGLESLKDFSVYYNDIDSLDLSHNLYLEYLNSNNNKIKKFQLPQGYHLKNLNCSFNELASFEMLELKGVESLNCSNNNLVYLNIQNGNNSKITSFNSTNNPALSCIQVDDSMFSTNNLNWKKDVSARFSRNCGYLGVDERSNRDMLLNPNPASDFIEISLDNHTLKGLVNEIRIYDVLGIEQSTSPQPLSMLGEGKIRLDVSHLTPGLYFVRVGEVVSKFVKL